MTETASEFCLSTSSTWAVWHSGLLVLWDKVGIVLLWNTDHESYDPKHRGQKRKRVAGKDKRISLGSPWGRGYWVSPKKGLMKPQKLHASLDCPWKAGKGAERNTLPGQVVFSLQPANFSSSCYTASFQKYDGLLHMNKPMMTTATRIREKITIRLT